MGEWLLAGRGLLQSQSGGLVPGRCLGRGCVCLGCGCFLGLSQGDLHPGSLHVLPPTLLAADQLPNPELRVVREGHGGVRVAVERR